MDTPWAVILDIFGPVAAVAVVLWFIFKYLKPRADQADSDRASRITELEAEVRRLSEEREAAKDSIINAFGDIGDGFETLANDVRALVESHFGNHEAEAVRRHDALLDRLDEHKTEIIRKLEGHSRNVQ